MDFRLRPVWCSSPTLGKAILMGPEMDDDKDETFEFYYKLIAKRSKKIGMDNESAIKQALKGYNVLEAQKNQESS